MLKSIIYMICKKRQILSCCRGYVICCQEYAIGAMLSGIYYWVKLYFTDICNLPTVP